MIECEDLPGSTVSWGLVERYWSYLDRDKFILYFVVYLMYKILLGKAIEYRTISDLSFDFAIANQRDSIVLFRATFDLKDNDGIGERSWERILNTAPGNKRLTPVDLLLSDIG